MEIKSFTNLKAFGRALIGPIVLALSIVAIFLFAHGPRGLKPFISYGFYLLVPAGTLLIMWTTYPITDILWALRASLYAKPSTVQECTHAKNILLHGADCAMTIGIMVTTLGMISMLFSIEDVVSIPRIAAYSLSGLFFGIFLSGAILVPLARRFEFPLASGAPGSASSSGEKRNFMGLFGLLLVLLCLQNIMYALSSALNLQPLPLQRDRAEVKIEGHITSGSTGAL